ncbi:MULTISPECIES: hypothetical protein [unclassified Mycobacterium]|uniref:hypothetical protein n=1 Tax=unclassified Mycobacterium TaxID=2642494 RepID=UPI0029C7559D|nr:MULTISPECIES: hypothetical protein [unclassified Mycobacterium]
MVIVGYSDDLAQAHSREARRIIAEHSDYLGIKLSQDARLVGRWRVEGHAGGLLATGINSGVTGFGAGLLVIDDPVKDAQEADSAAHCAAAGVPVIRLHDVRHTAATMLLDGGTTPSATAKWLGHDPAITLRVYGHVYDDALASAGDALLGRSRSVGDTST